MHVCAWVSGSLFLEVVEAAVERTSRSSKSTTQQKVRKELSGEGGKEKGWSDAWSQPRRGWEVDGLRRNVVVVDWAYHDHGMDTHRSQKTMGGWGSEG